MAAGINGLQPWLQPYAQYMVRLGAPYGVTLASTFRSYSEQLALWNNRGNSRYPVAPPGQSLHQQGRAFDLNGPEPVLRALGAYWKQLGGRWFESDIIHFEA